MDFRLPFKFEFKTSKSLFDLTELQYYCLKILMNIVLENYEGQDTVMSEIMFRKVLRTVEAVSNQSIHIAD